MAANSEVSAGIWPKLELIQAFIVALVTWKDEEDPFKNGGAKSGHNNYLIISVRECFQTLNYSELHSPWSDLAEFRTHLRFYGCPRYLQELRRSNPKKGAKVVTPF